MDNSTKNIYALCIGINEYSLTSGLQPLKYAEADAQSFYYLLETWGFPKSNIYLLLGKEATTEVINQLLSDLVVDQPKKEDLVIFYFAGHSTPIYINEQQESEVFLASYDFDRNKIKASRSFRKDKALGMNRLRKDIFEESVSRKVLFIFDSCYSGDFSGPNYRDNDADVEVIQSRVSNVFKNTTGKIALSSCLPTQKAVESNDFEHGIFTWFLLKALLGQDRKAAGWDGVVTVGTLFEYLCFEMKKYEQQPVKAGTEQGRFELISLYNHEELASDTLVEKQYYQKRSENYYINEPPYSNNFKTIFASSQIKVPNIAEKKSNGFLEKISQTFDYAYQSFSNISLPLWLSNFLLKLLAVVKILIAAIIIWRANVSVFAYAVYPKDSNGEAVILTPVIVEIVVIFLSFIWAVTIAEDPELNVSIKDSFKFLLGFFSVVIAIIETYSFYNSYNYGADWAGGAGLFLLPVMFFSFNAGIFTLYYLIGDSLRSIFW